MPNEDWDSKTSRAVRSNAHPASGGHANRGGKTSNKPPGLTSPYSRVNRSQWDLNPETGGSMADYVFHEYPKHVHPHPHDPKHFVVVNSDEEEAAVMAGSVLVHEEDERKRLVALAGVNNVQVDGRWGLPKMVKALEDAGVDPTQNPFA